MKHRHREKAFYLPLYLSLYIPRPYFTFMIGMRIYVGGHLVNVSCLRADSYKSLVIVDFISIKETPPSVKL